jgi:hypothetical protein
MPVVLGGLLLLAIAGAWSFRAQRDAARVEAAMATRTAVANAEALANATAEHERQVAALAVEAERARAQATRLGTNLEALRRDPSHATGAAPVLRDAVERLRAGRAGDPPRADPSP